MALTVGDRLGHYDVTALIGEGGMGQVYQATDTKLKRQVALKILPEAFSADPERLARFQREAEVLASLNHPNIAAIYGLEEADDTRALVLELVEGPTLADRIKRGPVPLDEALPIAKQIAEALEAAHEAGVIHRDLKPANIKVRDDGTVKVLDFGLAKALDPNPEGDPSQSPTLTAAATQMGVIMGTAAYMSPEQAKGKVTDKRADVWAFGCVLYEMLTARKPFAGDDVSTTLARVIEREPDWDALPRNLSPVLVTYLRRCLAKEPKQRVHDVADVRLAMEGAFDTPVSLPSDPVAGMPSRAWLRPWTFAVAVLASLGVGGFAVWSLLRPPLQPVARFTIPVEGQSLSSRSGALALSPDGQKLAYVATSAGAPQLYVRSLGQIAAVALRGTEDAEDVFWSPDGEWIGFRAAGMLKKVALAGGAPETLCESPGQTPGANWGLDDTIVFSHGVQTPLMRVSAFGGIPEPVTSLRTNEGEIAHASPEMLPGGAVLFTVFRGGSRASIAVQPADAADHRILIDGSSPRYVPTGHVIFGRDDTLWMVPFDVSDLEVTGPASPVLEGVFSTPRRAEYSIGGGTLVYAPRGVGGSSLVWLDRDGREQATGVPPGSYQIARLSPDGSQVSLLLMGEDDFDVWISEVERNTLSRFTTDPAVDVSGVWTPDGATVIFVSTREGGYGLFSRPADGAGAVQPLVTVEEAVAMGLWGRPVDSQRVLVSYLVPSSGWDVGLLSLDGTPSIQPVLDSEANERLGTLSPDGRWIAYQSDESGDEEVYVQRFPEGSERQRLSATGGVKPLWSPAGDALFYVRRNAVMTVPLEIASTLTAGRPLTLFETAENLEEYAVGIQDLSPDGQRFLAIMTSTSTQGEDAPRAQIILVQNWFEELTRLVPTP